MDSRVISAVDAVRGCENPGLVDQRSPATGLQEAKETRGDEIRLIRNLSWGSWRSSDDGGLRVIGPSVAVQDGGVWLEGKDCFMEEGYLM